MVKKQPKSIFPSQAVSDTEKASLEYGLSVGRAIEGEWFEKDRGNSRYYAAKQNYHQLKLYARGEQSIQKYKNELSINGDLSYLNLDWTPVPIVPKFVDIVVNGIAERTYELKAYSQDPSSIQDRTNYVKDIVENNVISTTGINTFKSDVNKLPENNDELALHMQLDYKESIEIAQEEALNNLMDLNKYDLIKKRLDYDIAVLGIAAVKNSFNTAEGIKIEYVDPADIVYSQTDSPYFDDLYYVGEVRKISIPELKKQFPDLSDEEIKEAEGIGSNLRMANRYNYDDDDGFINVLYFEYKTYQTQNYKIKKTGSGGNKSIKKGGDFNPSIDDNTKFKKASRAIEVLYTGAKIIGVENNLLKWELAENMTRPKSDITKVQMSYNIIAPRMYKGKAESLVSRMISFADMIQLTHLKLQQVLARMVPDGVYLDADGLAEVDLGNGTNYNPQEALNMFFQTGSVIGRSFTSEGDINPGKVPIQEITSGSGGNKMQALIGNYNYYLQMIRDVTGLNEARDGSMPDKNALVGVQKLAAANSNTATRHILQAGLYLTAETAECLSLRISDIIEYSPTKDAFIQAIGVHNVATLEEMSELHLYDFGIFIELQPDEEEKALLENNIQMALQQQSIELEDAIDLREIRSVKLANQMLKIRRKRKEEKDRQLQMENIQAQTQSNSQAAQAAAQAEVQKNQALNAGKAELMQMQAQVDAQKMMQEVQMKKELRALEFQYNMQLKGMETQGLQQREKEKEDRKDERTKIQATQQSEMIEQRNSGKPPKNFESAGNDILGGGFDLGSFDPR